MASATKVSRSGDWAVRAKAAERGWKAGVISTMCGDSDGEEDGGVEETEVEVDGVCGADGALMGGTCIPEAARV